jgi:hypothetical protein
MNWNKVLYFPNDNKSELERQEKEWQFCKYEITKYTISCIQHQSC